MLDEDLNTGNTAAEDAAEAPPAKRPARKRTTKKTAAPAVEAPVETAEAAPGAEPGADAPAEAPVARKPARKRAAKKATAPSAEAPPAETATADAPEAGAEPAPAEAPAAKKAPRKRTTKKAATPVEPPVEPAEGGDTAAPAPEQDAQPESDAAGPAVLFQAPVVTTTRRTRKKAAAKTPVAEPETPAEEAEDEEAAAVPGETEAATEAGDAEATQAQAEEADSGETGDADATDEDTDGEDGTPARRRRRRGGRRRRKSGENGSDDNGSGGDAADTNASAETTDAVDAGEDSGEAGADDQGDSSGEGTSRRRRRRRRAGEEGGSADSDDANTVTRVRQARSAEDQITAVTGSTRLEAKKQRRREGREAGRRRAPIVSEAEFLARRESVERVMVVRQREDLTQIAVLEDKVLVEHYVARESQTSLIGNIYLGRVQNVLPSMEAAFIDIGKGRNAVLYAGEVNWSALGHKEGQPRKIESVLQSGQTVLVQVTKDPVGHKGARLTSQISLAGRFLVYVPDGTTSGISRKLPDTERSRLKTLLKEIVPDTAGVIVRTAAEGASEEELTRDVERLKARWEDIEKKASGKGGGAQLLYGEPDLTLKVVRDLFTEDFTKLVIEGPDAWDTVHGYVSHVAPDLEDRLERFEPATEGKHAGKDVFATYRIEEQIQKGLDRKVWLPSGGSLIIDRTEAMTVVDVNTGKFTGSGGNLEETVTKNNLEAAEEIVRQLRLRDIGGIIVVDFIDMVLESNRDLVVRRLVECLGRDRTRHQVAEVTSLGLVQMTRKRIGTGLLEAFSETCEHCHGRGVVIKDAPVDSGKSDDDGSRRGGRRSRRGRNGNGQDTATPAPSPADVAAMARHEKAEDEASEDATEDAAAQQAPVEQAEVEQAPVEQAAAEQAPAEVTPDTEAPAEEAPAEETPAEEAPAEPAAEETPAEPAAPVVVTRTRRRAASRPAGPPPAVEAPPVELPELPAVSEDAPAPVVTHVPIKKRGTRKR